MSAKKYVGTPITGVKIRNSCAIGATVVGTLAANKEFIIDSLKIIQDSVDTGYDYQTNVRNTMYYTYQWGITSEGCVLLSLTHSKSFDGSGSTTERYVNIKDINSDSISASFYNTAQEIINTKSLVSSVDSGNEKYKKTMQLFGMPYQFLNSVDPRVDQINKYVGRNFINKIMLEAPVVTIIPGEPYYLPGISKENRNTYTDAFLQGASGTLDQIEQLISDSLSDDSSKNDKIRLYDFKSNYLSYIRYVNILCRTCATLLEINEFKYKYVSKRTSSGDAVWSDMDFDSFDWKNYRWDGTKYSSLTQNVLSAASSNVTKIFQQLKSFGNDAINIITGNTSDNNGTKTLNLQNDTDSLETDTNAADSMENAFRQVNYVQFYIDPERSGVSEDMSNNAGSSDLKNLLSASSQKMQDITFMARSGGVEETSSKIKEYGTSIIDGFKSALNIDSSGSSNIESVLARITDVASNIITGSNVIMPDIYQSSGYSKSYEVSIHLKALYGNVMSYYMDILVPAMHLLALALPRQTSANTYKSPFLVKVMMDGEYVCNLGLVTRISIDKKVSTESRNVDGLFTEWDISLSIQDLYSDLSLTPSNNPLLFLNNSSLIDYLSINCGLNSLEPRLSAKLKATLTNVKENVDEYIPNVMGKVTESLDSTIADWASIMG